jgi:hypothetical protein
LIAAWCREQGKARGVGVAVVCGNHGGDKRLEVGERHDEWG